MQCTTSLEDFIIQVEQTLPDFVTDRDLIDAGIAKTQAHLHRMRDRGLMPPFLKVGASIRYRKADVITWLKAQCHYPTTSQEVANG